MSNDIFELVEAKADLTQFNDYLLARRNALKAQAAALEQQRRGIFIEIGWIESVTGPKIVKRQE